jgi:SAM-dependent methyltransferase
VTGENGKVEARRRFDRWAPRYERDRRSRYNAAPQAAAVAALALGPGDRFLDVGCGSGAAVRAAAPRVARAVGVDLSPGMIERARELARGLATVEFVVGDSEALPFADASFDAVLCSASFHHYPHPELLAEPSADLVLARIADRFLRLADPSHVRLYRSSELVGLVEAAGLVEAECTAPATRGFVVVRARRRAAS